MDLHFLLAALAAAVALFVWGAVSWTVLPWHHKDYRAFKDDDAVVRAIEANAPVSGLYGIPRPGCGGDAPTEEARKAARAAFEARLRTGPRVQAVVVREGLGPTGGYMLRGFVVGLIACIVVAALLRQAAVVGLFHRTVFAAVAGSVGHFGARMLDWNWHDYPTRYTLVAIADAVVGWALAGFVLAIF